MARSKTQQKIILDLRPIFIKSVPGFANETEANQLALLRMFNECIQPKPNKDYFGAEIRINRVKEIWGRAERMYEVVSDKYFSVDSGSNLSGKCHFFMPNRYMTLAYLKVVYLPSTSLQMAYELTGKPYRDPGNTYAVSSTRKDGQQRVSKAQPSKHLEINISSLEKFIHSGLPEKFFYRAFWLLVVAKASNNKIQVRYEQAWTGRLYEQHGLQNINRVVRNAALVGCYDYDVSNCHYAIFKQLGERVGVDMPAIQDYLANKSEIRVRICKEVGLDATCSDQVQAVKTGLLSIIYGATLQDGFNSSLSNTFAKYPDAQKKFVSNSFVRALKKDVTGAAINVIKLFQDGKGVVTNDAGMKLRDARTNKVIRHPKSEKDIRRALAFILQGAEYAVLNSILEFYGDRIMLCMHDGWVMNAKHSLKDMESHIEQTTGYKLAVELTKISYPAPLDRSNEKVNKDVFSGSKNEEIFIEKQILMIENELKMETISAPARSSLVLSTRPSWNIDPASSIHAANVGRPKKKR